MEELIRELNILKKVKNGPAKINMGRKKDTERNNFKLEDFGPNPRKRLKHGK